MRSSRTRRVAAIFAAVAVVWLLPTFAAAQAVTTQLTAADVFDPMGLFGSPVGTLISPGTLTCPGAEPTGNPMQPCPPGSRINVRGMWWESRITSSSALLTGTFVNEGSSSFDENATGQIWGKFQINLDAGGAWQGTCNATRSKVGEVWALRVRCVGRGSGGAVEGMHIYFTEVATMPAFMVPVWFGSMDVEILAPPSR